MARSYTVRKIADEYGNPLLGIKCEGINGTTGAVAETQYTDSNGDAAFTALPDAGTVVNVKVYRKPFTIDWYRDIFLEACPISADHGGLAGLTDDDHTQYVLEASTDASGYGFVVDEDDMASNLATKVPTQQSVKAYVDSLIGTEEEVEDIIGGMLTGNTETFISVDYQDGDGTIDFVVPVKDEDDMASNSDTYLATQQSIKAYTDSAIDTDVATHAALDTGVHGAGANTLATDADIATHAGDASAHYTHGTMAAETATDYLKIADIDDTPVDNETNAPISSNWAYDHAADTSTHGVDQVADDGDALVYALIF